MKKMLFLISAVMLCIIFIAADKNSIRKPTVTISTTSLDITSANGVTMKYIVRGYEAKNLNGVEHGSCLNTTTNPVVGKDGSIKSRGVAGTVDSKGAPAPVGTFYCAAYTNNLKSGVKYFVKPYIKLQDGSIIYGSEKTVTMK